MLPKIARFCYRKRWLVLIVWIVLLFSVVAWSRQAGDAFATDFALPSSDSQAATTLLEERFPARSGLTGELVFKAETGVKDPHVMHDVQNILGQISGVEHVVGIVSPYDPQAVGQVSPSGKIAKATILFDRQIQDAPQATSDAISSIISDNHAQNIQYELGGEIFGGNGPGGKSELIGLVAAVIILLIAFGSLLAMGLPILTALFGIGIGISLVSLLAHVLNLPEFTTQLASMIGIGVGIDYALFIVTRYRQELHNKQKPEQAVVTAINTAGRSVIFAGITVVISLMGMVLMNISFIQGLGVGAASVVAVTMLASITLLPAILGFAGKNIDKLRVPGIKHEVGGAETGIWNTWSKFIEKHTWPVLLVGLAILLTLAIPVLSIRLGSSDASSRSTNDTTRRAYDLQSEGFGPGSNGPLILAAELNKPSDIVTLQKVGAAVAEDENVAFVAPPIPNDAKTTAIIQVIPKTAPQDEATIELIHRLRKDVIPPATAGADVRVHVGGITAAFEDIANTLSERLPIFIGTVLALSFVLLMLVFRSILIPTKAVILNMLSITAAYGVVVAVFQWGWFSSLFGVGTGPVESFLPMIMFAILFGLSMDYEVFLLSRIKEEYDQLGNNNQAIARGLNSTARVITAAAAIMITVFGSFVLQDERIIKEFGLGLAVAVFIDASIARLLLVPASMELFGKANWWFPKWLQWLPKVHIDGNETVNK